jgi:hypothetical protein
MFAQLQSPPVSNRLPSGLGTASGSDIKDRKTGWRDSTESSGWRDFVKADVCVKCSDDKTLCCVFNRLNQPHPAWCRPQ